MCVPLENIKKILPLVSLDKVPGGPVWLAGLMNIHENIIPVIDIAIRTGMNRYQKYSLDMPVLLGEKNHRQVGMIVDDIFELSGFDKEQLKMAPQTDISKSPYLGTVTQNSHSSLLIDIDFFLDIQLTGDENVYADKYDK
jgi:purine-binding chemotaxis protein CheW